MTVEELNKIKSIQSEIKWCSDILYHIAHRNTLSFRFDTTRSCIENYEYKNCPTWLLEIIEKEIRNRKNQKDKEFEEI